ncbi:MAG: transposase [Stigonema ocellatum SAG 48.90 = DSM 106950]|nr:transposase [Stigonema ocellatum SAG 48.90 = DSM 106950]
MYGCQQNLISPDTELAAILEFICSESHKLTNCGIYYARQLYFKTRKIVGKFDLEVEYKNNPHFQALYSQASQQILRSVAESFKSFKELSKLFQRGELKDKPRPPSYRKNNGLALVTYPKQALKLIDGLIRIPLGNTVKRWFKLDSFTIPMPTNLKFEDIKELRILPRNRCFYVEFVYKQQPVSIVNLDQSKVLGIDHGINNWLTCVSNVGTSFIVDGLKLKSLNQWYNKQVSTIKEGKSQGFWNEKLAHITEKRNRQVRDAVNKAARFVINHCLDNKIGTLVFGWNIGQKDGADMGKKNNQKFVQIPTGRLKDRIAQLCEQYGIQFVETEESYTSRSSFLDNDALPVFGEKPEGWHSSGKRVHRGLFKTATNFLINADCNGAANIIRKVAVTLGLDLTEISRASLTTPQRLFIWKNPTPSRGGIRQV